ncbi:MAG TPA: alpha/beta fold hydrolase, partial [Pirellulaceae bacterium]|nr:alpha/beta fold hydrolase [Pirellulaceae bacterium]
MNWLADRLILEPTTEPIETEDRQRHVISSTIGEFELWSIGQLAQEQPVQHLVVLKFPGTGGRAERVRQHPAECWSDVAATIYAVNPPGYGRSPGTARVNHMAPVADAAFQYVTSKHPKTPLLVVGNSLGCLPALYLAARQRVCGVYLRNPAVVHQLIRQRWIYNWWNAGLARWLARSLPHELDAYVNAPQASA